MELNPIRLDIGQLKHFSCFKEAFLLKILTYLINGFVSKERYFDRLSITFSYIPSIAKCNQKYLNQP
jgi:hypothetical protein